VAWQIIGSIRDVEAIAAGAGLKARHRLRKRYGARRWRKCKGVATIQLTDGMIHRAEVHWYEATGFGRVEMKIKRLLPDDR